MGKNLDSKLWLNTDLVTIYAYNCKDLQNWKYIWGKVTMAIYLFFLLEISFMRSEIVYFAYH